MINTYIYDIFSCSSFYSVNFFQGTSQCVVQRLTNSTRGYSVLGFLIVFFKYSMAHGDLRFLNGRAGRGNNTVIVCIIQAKLYVGMYSKFATFFINWIHLSIQYGLAAKFFFKTNGTNLRHSVHKFLHYRKACNYLAYFSNYLMVAYQSPHCKRIFFSFIFIFLFLHTRTLHIPQLSQFAMMSQYVSN